MTGDDEAPKMRDIPMLLIDRERMREEFGEGFDDMTFAEFNEASVKRVAELKDFVKRLGDEPGAWTV